MHNVIHDWLRGEGPWGQGGDVETCFLVSLGTKKKASVRRGIVPIHHGCHMTLAQKISAPLYILITNKPLKETNNTPVLFTVYMCLNVMHRIPSPCL